MYALRLLVVALIAFLIMSIQRGTVSEIVTRDVGKTKLIVTNTKAQVSYGGKTFVASGAINARPPSKTIKQVHFKKTYGAVISRGSCLRVFEFPLLDKACRAPDGSYWALQRWERLVPNYGGTHAAEEIEISHWTGSLPQFENVKWTTKYNLPVLCGEFMYRNHGVYGFTSTPTGVPTDSYGRLIYVDAKDSDYGEGWRRVNSFLTHPPNGNWCYLFADHKGGSGRDASEYRITANGPGVTPIIRLEVKPQ